MRIGVAVSGGGHRATAWALGSLAALVEIRANADVVSLSSVSGGSIANAAVASAGDFRRYVDSAAFAADIGPTLRLAGREGLFFPGRATRNYVTATLAAAGLTVLVGLGLLAALIAAGRESALIGYGITGALAGAIMGRALAGVVRQRVALVALIGAVLGALVSGSGAALTGGLHGLALGATLAGLGLGWLGLAWVAVVLFSGRGKAVERALAAGLLAHPQGGRALKLADIRSPVNHVLCATDLESGDHFYMAPRFLYGFREGISSTGPSRVTLAAAVQASAALPGAFPPAVISTGAFTRDSSITVPAASPDRVVLSDGGVYDNMADQWESGLATRLTVCEPLRSLQEAAEILIVANASAAWEWRPFDARGRIGRELLGLARDQGVQYDVSTARRRNQLLERFESHRVDGGPGLVGVIVMIDRLPMRLAAPFTAGDDDIASRAREAVTYIDACHNSGEWQAMADGNARVPTTLGPIGEQSVLDLMEQSYTSTMVGLYVLHGIGALKPFPRACYEAVMKEAG